MNERTAMQATAVYSCVRILAEAVRQMVSRLREMFNYNDGRRKKFFCVAVFKKSKVLKGIKRHR